jgi:hypothetical protein
MHERATVTQNFATLAVRFPPYITKLPNSPFEWLFVFGILSVCSFYNLPSVVIKNISSTFTLHRPLLRPM